MEFFVRKNTSEQQAKGLGIGFIGALLIEQDMFESKEKRSWPYSRQPTLP